MFSDLNGGNKSPVRPRNALFFHNFRFVQWTIILSHYFSFVCIDGSVCRQFSSILSIVFFFHFSSCFFLFSLLSFSPLSYLFDPKESLARKYLFLSPLTHFLPIHRFHNVAWWTTVAEIRIEHYSGALPDVLSRVGLRRPTVLYIVMVIYVPWSPLLITISATVFRHVEREPGQNERKSFFA